MTQRIFRYGLYIIDRQTVRLPVGHTILSVAESRTSDQYLDMWALVNPEDPATDVSIRIFGTGHPVPTIVGTFVGTVVARNGLVWHVFREQR